MLSLFATCFCPLPVAVISYLPSSSAACPPPPSTAVVCHHYNHCHHSAVSADYCPPHSHRCLLSAAAILAISGLPLLPLFLVCGLHLCHLSSTISLPLVAAAISCLRQSLAASTVTSSHLPVPPTLPCSCHHLRLCSSSSLYLLRSALAHPPSYLNLVDRCVRAIFSQCFSTSKKCHDG
jgi:hypothetical protein